MQELNQEILSLNDEIKEWKRLEDWVKLREKKIENLEKISNAEKLNKPNSIDFVNKLLNELDDDLSSYGKCIAIYYFMKSYRPRSLLQ